MGVFPALEVVEKKLPHHLRSLEPLSLRHMAQNHLITNNIDSTSRLPRM